LQRRFALASLNFLDFIEETLRLKLGTLSDSLLLETWWVDLILNTKWGLLKRLEFLKGYFTETNSW
jgi:hypothetical protein